MSSVFSNQNIVRTINFKNSTSKNANLGNMEFFNFIAKGLLLRTENTGYRDKILQ